MRAKHIVLSILLVACGDSGSNPDASLPDATTAADAGADSPLADAGSDVESTMDANEAGPTGCAARTTDDLKGVYVSTSTGADSNGCGTRTIPCKTIQRGITEATNGKTTIYVASGSYVESITLAAGLTVEGGWSVMGLGWTPICDNTMTTAVGIQGVTNTTVTASFNGSSTLRDLSITSKASATSNESLYGISAVGAATKLTLDQVNVHVGAGGPGVAGSDGAPGADGSDAGCTASTGAAGVTGSIGAGGATGTFTSNGYVVANGANGGAGGTGKNGTAAGNGTCATCQKFTGSCPNSCTFGSGQICAGNGASGCAGTGGGNGTLGTGGGASIALFIWDANVNVLGSTLVASAGGDGANGGSGSDGGAGSAGIAGASAFCATQLSNPTCFMNSCSGTLVSSTNLSGGAAGGAGGVGGVGGHGGGGSGGWSYAIVAGGDAGVVSLDAGALAHGDAGSGGLAGGASGQAGDRWP